MLYLFGIIGLVILVICAIIFFKFFSKRNAFVYTVTTLIVLFLAFSALVYLDTVSLTSNWNSDTKLILLQSDDEIAAGFFTRYSNEPNYVSKEDLKKLNWYLSAGDYKRMNTDFDKMLIFKENAFESIKIISYRNYTLHSDYVFELIKTDGDSGSVQGMVEEVENKERLNSLLFSLMLNKAIKDNPRTFILEEHQKDNLIISPENVLFQIDFLVKSMIFLNTDFVDYVTIFFNKFGWGVSTIILIFVVIMIIGGFLFYEKMFLFFAKSMLLEKVVKGKERRLLIEPNFEALPFKFHNLFIGKVAEYTKKAYFDPSELLMHTLIAGSTGCGKSVAGSGIAEELLKKKVPVIVFDPTAQWTGFVKPCKDEKMLSKYKAFGIGKNQKKGFKSQIINVEDHTLIYDIKHYMKKPLTVFSLSYLSPGKLDRFMFNMLNQVFRSEIPESNKLKALIVIDEVHRLLPKYGGKVAYIKLEQAVREFRKWGIGLVLISQVLTDFKSAIRGNISTEIQMRTKFEGDIKRITVKYGLKYSRLVTKFPIGTGMIQCPAYNNGNPYFIEFKPLLHDPHRLLPTQMKNYESKKIKVLEKQDTKEYETQKQLAKKNISSVNKRVKQRKEKLEKIANEIEEEKVDKEKEKLLTKTEKPKEKKKKGFFAKLWGDEIPDKEKKSKGKKEEIIKDKIEKTKGEKAQKVKETKKTTKKKKVIKKKKKPIKRKVVKKKPTRKKKR